MIIFHIEYITESEVKSKVQRIYLQINEKTFEKKLDKLEKKGIPTSTTI